GPTPDKPQRPCCNRSTASAAPYLPVSLPFIPQGTPPSPLSATLFQQAALVPHLTANPAHDSIELIDEAAAASLSIRAHQSFVIGHDVVGRRIESRPDRFADVAQIAEDRVGVVHLVRG